MSRWQTCWTGGSAGWPRCASTGMPRSGTGAPKTGSATPSGPTTACRRGCARWWSSRSPIWPTPGRCAAGVGCCTGSGTSSAPPARSSASAAGCTESPHDKSITDTLNQIRHQLADDRGVPIVAVSGSPGVGKTALAIHAAHGLTERFPDGQLYVNLHGSTAGLGPLAPLEVLGRVPAVARHQAAAIPATLEEASAAFRSRVAGRRLLVVLDNAADAAQVAPLLPASLGCGVLVTSRGVLSALDGARHLPPDVLPAAEARTGSGGASTCY